MEYETELNRGIGDQPMFGALHLSALDVRRDRVPRRGADHQFAVAKRRGLWEVVETPQLTQAKAEIARLNRDLEQRVLERTTELEAAIEEQKRASAALQEAQKALAHVTRLTTISELTASLAHEVNQPLAAIVANATAKPVLARSHAARSRRGHRGDAASDPGRPAGGRRDRACACAREEAGRGEVPRGRRFR